MMPIPVRRKSSFEEAFVELIAHEGGLSLDPKDPGNWTGGRCGVGKLLGTKYGIAANTFPHIDIPNLTLAEAKVLYKKHYWDSFKGDELDHEVACQMFDGDVNSGLGNATRWMQTSLGVTVDGAFGPKTLAALKASDPLVFMPLFNAHRLLFMTDRTNWRDASKGWARRIAMNLIRSVTP